MWTTHEENDKDIHVVADVNMDNFTPLMTAALQGQRQVVQLLLRETAVKVSAQNNKGGAWRSQDNKPTGA